MAPVVSVPQTPPPQAQQPNRGVVITGGTRGLGFAFAREFLRHGDSVLITGRDRASVDASLHALSSEFGSECRVSGIAADISVTSDVERLGEVARDQVGVIHTWVNNAGRASSQRKPLWELEADDVMETGDR